MTTRTHFSERPYMVLEGQGVEKEKKRAASRNDDPDRRLAICFNVSQGRGMSAETPRGFPRRGHIHWLRDTPAGQGLCHHVDAYAHIAAQVRGAALVACKEMNHTQSLK